MVTCLLALAAVVVEGFVNSIHYQKPKLRCRALPHLRLQLVPLPAGAWPVPVHVEARTRVGVPVH